MPPRPDPKRPILTAVMIALLAALLVLGLARLFSLRFSSGEIYPAYSTLRADPLGAKLLYQSLKQSRFLSSVERHFTKLDQIDYPPDTTFVMLAAEERFDDSHDRIERGMASALFGVMNTGGRVALSYKPYFHYEDPDGGTASNETAVATNDCELACDNVNEGDEGDEEADSTDSAETNLCCSVTRSNTLQTAQWLGFETTYAQREQPQTATATRAVEPSSLPETLRCGTDLCFTNLSMAWTTLYERDGHPVVIERRVGKGSLALSTLSYPFSNEALRDHRSSEFLIWFIGNDSHHVRFSERHHGLLQDPNTASLIRKHRLHWPLWGLLITALLLVWQQASSLLPRHDEATGQQAATSGSGDSTQALTNLLRRSIPGNRIAATCMEQWESSLPRVTRDREALLDAVHQAQQQAQGEGRHTDRHIIARHNQTVDVIRAAKHSGATTTAQLNRQKGATT
jgi:hypothetical protein